MRLINETTLSEAIRDYFIKKIDKGEYKVDTVDCHADIQAILRSQPTAYDPEKVVEQLEDIKMRHFLTIANTGDDKLDLAYEYVGNALDTAIEIVKSGGKV